ncbi:MAG: MAPEG family protein [Pseudomonadota bacterium]
MTALPVYASLTAATLLLLQLGLMLSVGLARVRHNQGIGDGGHDDLALLIRRHGNLAENAALFVAVLALLEILGGAPSAVLALGAGFVLVRISHAVGLSLGEGANAPRFVGAMGTVALGIGTAGYLVYVALSLL